MQHFSTETILPIINIVGIVILCLIVKDLLPTYLKEKIKNVATKEDVGKITELVEAAKFSFTKETEGLKAKLQFLGNIKGSLYTEERNAIIDLNEKYFTWINHLADFSLNYIDITDNTEIEKYQRETKKVYIAFRNSETRFNLFIEDEELKSLVAKMTMEALEKLASVPETYLGEIYNSNRLISSIKENTDLSEQSEKHDKFEAERQMFHDNLIAAIIENYGYLVPLHLTFQRKCREYLSRIIREKYN